MQSYWNPLPLASSASARYTAECTLMPPTDKRNSQRLAPGLQPTLKSSGQPYLSPKYVE
jgi:hypothetical protein